MSARDQGGGMAALGEGKPLPIDHFARLLIPGDFAGKSLAICTGFGDPVAAPITLTAIFFGTVADWRSCERDWTETLAEFGIAPRRVLDPAALEERLRVLGSARRRSFVQKLGALIGDHGLFGRAAFIRSADIAGLPLDDEERLQLGQVKHALCLEECLGAMFGVVEGHFPDRDMTVIFKSGANDIDNLKVYDSNRLRNHKGRGLTQLKNILFSSKEDFTALQVMDILAYSILLSCVWDDLDHETLRKWIAVRTSPLPIHVIEIDPGAVPLAG